jgi:hypothetical protein
LPSFHHIVNAASAPYQFRFSKERSTMMHLILMIDIDGDIDQSGLDRLRTHLNLKKQGRLTDDWDQEFGYRIIQHAGGQRINIGLSRELDRSWLVDASASDPNVSSDELALLRAELIEGITASGYQATVRAKPTFGTKP